MGEYYNWVNVDKREYISPCDFGFGSKRTESLTRGNSVLCALKELLNGRWEGDHVAFLGDEFAVSEDEENPLLRELYRQIVLSQNPGCVMDLVDEKYRNVSCFFKDAEQEVRQEILFSLDDIKSDRDTQTLNRYRVNLKNPFVGLFLNAGYDFRYTINYTKRICYSFDKTRVLYQNHAECDYADPLPLLMGCGRTSGVGLWLGDIVGTANDMPVGFALLDVIYLDW